MNDQKDDPDKFPQIGRTARQDAGASQSTVPAGPVTVAVAISGRVDSPEFPDWIARHALKLGICTTFGDRRSDRVEVRASGPEEMVQAFALGCSLGPASVHVDDVAVVVLTD